MPSAVKKVAQIAPGDHCCLPYDSDEEQREAVTAYLVAGLARGQKVVYFSDGTAPEMLLGWLRARNVDAGPACAVGQLEVRSVEETYLAAGRFDADEVLAALRAEVEAAHRAGFTGLWVAGEMNWALRGVPGADQLPDYERRLHDVYAEGGVTGLCQYDRRLFGELEARRFAALHPWKVQPDALHDDGSLRITTSYHPPGLAVAGSVDRVNCSALASAVEDWIAREMGDLHVEMSKLEFIDVAGLRVLVRAAAALTDRRLHVVNLAPELQRVVHLVGWHEAPGMVLAGEAVGA